MELYLNKQNINYITYQILNKKDRQNIRIITDLESGEHYIKTINDNLLYSIVFKLLKNNDNISNEILFEILNQIKLEKEKIKNYYNKIISK